MGVPPTLPCSRLKPGTTARLVLRAYTLAAAALSALISFECFFTARYFHPPVEIISGVAVGLLCFQLPLLIYSGRLLRAQQGGGKGASEQAANAAGTGW